MAAAFDPFEVLGVSRNATPEQIRAAYREQVARFHPDKHHGNPLEELAAAKLVEINRAYEMLSKAPPSSSAGSSSPSRAAPAPVAEFAPFAKLFRSLAVVAGLVFLLRFGLVLGREIFALLRGIVISILWLFRVSPIFGVAVVVALALGTSFVLRTRKGRS